MEILNEYSSLSPVGALIVFVCFFACIILLAMCYYHHEEKNRSKENQCTVFLILCVSILLFVSFFNENVRFLHHQCVEAKIDESVSFHEVMDHYELFDQRGEIYVLIRKGEQ